MIKKLSAWYMFSNHKFRKITLDDTWKEQTIKAFNKDPYGMFAIRDLNDNEKLIFHVHGSGKDKTDEFEKQLNEFILKKPEYLVTSISVSTYRATIYIGLKEGYDGVQHSEGEAYELLQQYCDDAGFAVSVKPVGFIYKDGNEWGLEIGLINYPRFPKESPEIKNHAKKIAMLLMTEFKQYRCSIVCTDETILLETIDENIC